MPQIFYLGALISSIGTQLLFVSFTTIWVISTHPYAQLGLLFGCARAAAFISHTTMGGVLNRGSPFRWAIWLDFGLVVSCYLLWKAWNKLDQGGFPLLVAVFCLRSFLNACQENLRAKIGKHLVELKWINVQTNSIWLNKISQGAFLFSAILTLIMVKDFSLKFFVIIDAITFVISIIAMTIMMRSVRKFENTAGVETLRIEKQTLGISFIDRLKSYYKDNRYVAYGDFWLLLIYTGFNTLTAKLSESSAELFPMLMICYGLSVWTGGYLVKTPLFQSYRNTGIFCFAGIGLSFLSLMLTKEFQWVLVLSTFVRDNLFWILFHRLTTEVQKNNSEKILIAVSSIRNAQLVLLFAGGEALVGWSTQYITLNEDLSLRAVISIVAAVLFILLYKNMTKITKATQA